MRSFFYVPRPASWRVVRDTLNRYYVLGLGAFLSIGHRELDLLAVGQGFETITLYGTEVNENVGAAFALDKAEALGFVEPLNGASYLRHILLPVFLTTWRRLPGAG